MARRPKNLGNDDKPRAGKLDPIIEGLFARLPRSGDEWAEADRRNWLQMLEQAFKVVYEVPEPDSPPGTP